MSTKESEFRRSACGSHPAWIKQARKDEECPLAMAFWTSPCWQPAAKFATSPSSISGCGEGRFCRILVEHSAQGGWGLKLANRWLTPRSLRMSSKPDAVADVVAAV